MFKITKQNLILLIFILTLGIVAVFNFSNALLKTGIPKPSVAPPCEGSSCVTKVLCTGTTACTSWDICINGIKTCYSSGYTLTPSGCTYGTVYAPTSTCPVSSKQRSAYGYAWSDNIGYMSFSGNIGSAAPEVPASCTPDSPLTQTLSCPSGQTGEITQTRTSTCPGPVTSAWTTISNTCTTPIVCTPDSPLTQTLSCPAGQTGSITQTRTSTCPGPVTSDWVTTSNTCVTPKTVPGSPTGLSASSAYGKVTISFNPPTSDGGSSITSYKLSVYVNGLSKTITQTQTNTNPITVTGIPNYESNRYWVYAINAQGQGSGAYIDVSAEPQWSSGLGTGNWSAAYNACNSRGWTLPSWQDFNMAYILGKASIAANTEYWTSTKNGVGEIYVYVRNSAGQATGYYISPWGTTQSIRCAY